MRRFISLDAPGVPGWFDPDVHGAQPLVDVTEQKGRIELTYRFPGFFRSSAERKVSGTATRFDKIDLGAGFLAECGKPVLPSCRRAVQIPGDCDWRVRVTTPARPREIEGVRVIRAPARTTDNAPRATDDGADGHPIDELFPRDLVLVSGPLEVNGYRALVVHVRPLQYNPMRRLLVCHTRIDVAIELLPRASAWPPAPGTHQRAPIRWFGRDAGSA